MGGGGIIEHLTFRKPIRKEERGGKKRARDRDNGSLDSWAKSEPSKGGNGKLIKIKNW